MVSIRLHLICFADKSPSNHRHNRVSSTEGASGSGSSHSSSSSKDKSSERHSSSKTIKDDVDPSRIKTLQDSPDHITSKMNHSALSADRIHTTNDDSSSSNSMSVDMDGAQPTSVHHRPKTVKMIGSKMRSTGNHRSSTLTILMSFRTWDDAALVVLVGFMNISRSTILLLLCLSEMPKIRQHYLFEVSVCV